MSDEKTINTENSVKSAEKPKKIYKPNMALYRFFRFVTKPLAVCLWPTKIINKENYTNFGGGLIMCNHYSTLDGVVMAAKLFRRELHVVIKVEAFAGSTIADWFLGSMGGIPVRRGEADIQAVKSIMEVLKDEDKQLLIFPEGTRNKADDQHMGDFKDGAARFAIKGKKQLLPMIYFHSPKTFRKNWLYIGEPFDLSEFYGDKPTEENKKRATAYVRAIMDETRRKCNEYVAAHSRKYAKQLASSDCGSDATK